MIRRLFRNRNRLALIRLAAALCVAAPGSAFADQVLNDTADGPHPVLDFPGDLEIAGAKIYRTPSHDSEGRPDEILTIRRGQHVLLSLRADHFELNYRGETTGAGPDLILTSGTGGAHCCFTIHVLWLGHDSRQQVIPVLDNDEAGFLSEDSGPPKLRFGDFTFAYWHTSFADSPAPTVIFKYDTDTGRYMPDIEAMREPPPNDDALDAMVREIQDAETKLPKGDSPPAPLLWSHMLDLIYSGNAQSARRLVDLAWPEDRPDKSVFLACFTERLAKSIWWRSVKLGRLLDAEATFHASAATRKACADYEQ